MSGFVIEADDKLEIRSYNGGLAVDERGVVRFVNDFNFKGVKRFYQVENHRKGFIRAWHGHQVGAKYVYVTNGTILLRLVKMSDPTVQVKFTLSSLKPTVLYIPPGYYNGFKTLEEHTNVMFFSTTTLDEDKNDDIRASWDLWDNWDEKFF